MSQPTTAVTVTALGQPPTSSTLIAPLGSHPTTTAGWLLALLCRPLHMPQRFPHFQGSRRRHSSTAAQQHSSTAAQPVVDQGDSEGAAVPQPANSVAPSSTDPPSCSVLRIAPTKDQQHSWLPFLVCDERSDDALAVRELKPPPPRRRIEPRTVTRDPRCRHVVSRLVGCT
jgi:hypothetical protein